MKLLNFGQQLLARIGKGSQRPPFEGIYAYLLSALIGYGIADSVVLEMRPKMLSKKPASSAKRRGRGTDFQSKKDYRHVLSRNIFNSAGEDPPRLSSDDKNQDAEQQIAVKSQLPLTLEGTIVHLDPKKSVATIVAKSSNESDPYSVGDPIEGLVEKITKIERRKVTFIAQNSGRLEYIEIPLNEKITLNIKDNSKSSGKDGEEVVKRGEFDFQLKRSDVSKYLNDLSSVLSQARMQPNSVPGGGVDGFRFTAIQPGSIYEKLGFKIGDVIKGVNGEPVNSPTKAMELYNALKGQEFLELEVIRNGSRETFTYNISE